MPEPTEIGDEQKRTWNKFSQGWKKWDDFVMNWIEPVGDLTYQRRLERI